MSNFVLVTKPINNHVQKVFGCDSVEEPEKSITNLIKCLYIYFYAILPTLKIDMWCAGIWILLSVLLCPIIRTNSTHSNAFSSALFPILPNNVLHLFLLVVIFTCIYIYQLRDWKRKYDFHGDTSFSWKLFPPCPIQAIMYDISSSCMIRCILYFHKADFG